MNELVQEAARLRTVTSSSNLVDPILIVFGRVSAQARSWSQAEFGFRLWDLDELREKA